MKVYLSVLISCYSVFSVVAIYNDYELLKKLRSVCSYDSISTQCRQKLKLFLNKLNDTKDSDDIWALQMFDASSKMTAGIMSYHCGELGNFEQCIGISSENDHITGKYCLGNVVFDRSLIENNSIFFRDHIYLKNIMLDVADGYSELRQCSWALCLPSNCSDNDAIKILEGLDTLALTTTSVTCQTSIDVYPKLDASAIIGITVLSIYLMIVIISTAIDLVLRSKQKVMVHPVFTTFSMYTNGKTLFSIPKRTSLLSCLDGLRFISMLWVILLHVYMTYQKASIVNYKNLLEFADMISSMIIVRGRLACDTFLLIGGILVTYVCFSKDAKSKLTILDILKHYLHRYIRLTPALAAMILVFTTLGKYMGSGPNWSTILSSVKNCKNYWWSPLLYVQNQVNSNELCTVHTWYLDVDMQLYILSPIIFWLFRISYKLGTGLVTVVTLLSIAFSFTQAYIYGMYSVESAYDIKGSLATYLTEFYAKTETRASPWFIGIIFGYILATKKNLRVKLPKIYSLILWTLSLIILGVCVFGDFPLRQGEYRRVENALCIALMKPTFAIALCWIIWACATEQGGIINQFLSLRLFQFMNRFTLSIYLLHHPLLHLIFFASKTPIYFSVFNVIYDSWGLMLLSFLLSIIWVLIFEYPMLSIEKRILRK